ncbi:MAG: GNAT family N-acetyltransferase [Saccharofermentanaceae bacterium]|nr:GNAT family N-acetyltransferase [Saccharofermentanaceae bacterium]
MKYVIMSGRFETGTEEQKMMYTMLFGQERIQYFFDLYFHWYNLVHEMGHCIVEKQNAVMSKVAEEMYVNALAVSYYRYMGEDEKLAELKGRLEKILSQVPSPVPEGETFLGFYEKIWNTEQINDVMIYGYFQLNSVLEILNKEDLELKTVLKTIGINMHDLETKETCDAEIKSENAVLFLNDARENLLKMGVDVPEIRLELQDNPMVQCARLDISYRKLEEKDLPVYIDMRMKQLREEGSHEETDIVPALLDYYHRHMADGTFVAWLALEGDEVIGTSGMSFVERPPHFRCPNGKLGLLSSMFTSPYYRRQGIARELLHRVVEEAREYGCSMVQITASDMGVKLYTAYGFEHNGNFMQYNLL